MTEAKTLVSDPWSRLATEVAQSAILRSQIDNAGLKYALGEDRSKKSDRSALLVVSRGTLRFKDLLEMMYKDGPNLFLVPLLWQKPIAIKASWAEKVRAVLASECNASLPTKPWLPKLLARLREDGNTIITEKRLLKHLHSGEMHLSFALQCLAALNSPSLAEIGLISRDALALARKADIGERQASGVLDVRGYDTELLDFTNLWPRIENISEVGHTAQSRSSNKAKKTRDTTDATASKSAPSARSRIAKPNDDSPEE